MEITEEDKKKAARKEYKRQWVIKNRETIKAKKKKYRLENVEDIKNKQKEYYKKNIETCKSLMKKYRQEHSESLKIKKNEYYQKNSEDIKLKRKDYQQKNSEAIKSKQKEYRDKNSEYLKEQRKEYYRENVETLSIKRKNYYQKHSKEIKTKQKEYIKNRLKTDPLFRMVQNLRRRLHHALKSQVAKKSIKTLDEIGCTPEFLRNHLESQFKEGMTWDNHGIRGWHVDHIKPCIAFDLNNPEEQKIVNHYTNLQPLWWYENLSKGDKILQ